MIPAMVQRLRFSIYVQHGARANQRERATVLQCCSNTVPAVKTPVGAIAKNTQKRFHGGGVAYLWSHCLIMLIKRRCTIARITVLTATRWIN